MGFKRGDHICAIYSTTDELTREVADFLAEGLRCRQRCWYVGAGNEMDSVRTALCKRGLDVTAETERGGLKLISGDGAYVVHRAFDPAVTIQIFNDAIEQASTDGFAEFRAAAEMSWALDAEVCRASVRFRRANISSPSVIRALAALGRDGRHPTEDERQRLVSLVGCVEEKKHAALTAGSNGASMLRRLIA